MAHQSSERVVASHQCTCAFSHLNTFIGLCALFTMISWLTVACQLNVVSTCNTAIYWQISVLLLLFRVDCRSSGWLRRLCLTASTLWKATCTLTGCFLTDYNSVTLICVPCHNSYHLQLKSLQWIISSWLLGYTGRVRSRKRKVTIRCLSIRPSVCPIFFSNVCGCSD